VRARQQKGRIAAVEMVALARCQRSPIVELPLGAVHPGKPMPENNLGMTGTPLRSPQIPNIRPRPKHAKTPFRTSGGGFAFVGLDRFPVVRNDMWPNHEGGPH
jgi:hypothetical protein